MATRFHFVIQFIYDLSVSWTGSPLSKYTWNSLSFGSFQWFSMHLPLVFICAVGEWPTRTLPERLPKAWSGAESSHKFSRTKIWIWLVDLRVPKITQHVTQPEAKNYDSCHGNLSDHEWCGCSGWGLKMAEDFMGFIGVVCSGWNLPERLGYIYIYI